MKNVIKCLIFHTIFIAIINPFCILNYKLSLIKPDPGYLFHFL